MPGGASGDLPALPPFICCPLTLQPTFCPQPWVLPHPLGSQKTCGTIKTSWWGSWTLREKGEKPEVPPSLASESRRAVSAQMPLPLGLGSEQRWRPPSPRHSARLATSTLRLVLCVCVGTLLICSGQTSTHVQLKEKI